MEDANAFSAGSMDGYNKPSGLGDDNAASDGSHHKEPYYSMPGVLHFLQTEWAKFEMDRSLWEVERAELQARIAFLQGERKGQENLKHDLVRRIRMLEFALKQERTKYHRLKFGTDPPGLTAADLARPDLTADEAASINLADPEELLQQTTTQTAASKAKAKDGRQLIRQYLQEFGYADSVLDAKQARLQHIIGNSALDEPDAKHHQMQQQQQQKRGRSIAEQMSSLLPNVNITCEDDDDDDDDDQRFPNVKQELGSLSEEDQAIAEFDFLVSQPGGNSDQTVDQAAAEDEEWAMDEKTRSKVEAYKAERIRAPKKSAGGSGGARNLLNAFADEADSSGGSPPPPETEPTGPYPNLDDPELLAAESNAGSAAVSGSSSSSAEDEGFRSALGLSLGDLQDITVANESEAAGPDTRRTWTSKFSLRSHFDCVRALAFHPSEAALISASDDSTLKLWNIAAKSSAAGQQQHQPNKKGATLDLEPTYTFRGHCGPVLSLCIADHHLFSAGLDASVRVWTLPQLTLDSSSAYDAYDPTVVGPVLTGHQDAVWGLALSSSGGTDTTLFSCAADGEVKAWRPLQQADQLLATWRMPATPTSVAMVATDASKLIVSMADGQCALVDAETGQTVCCLTDDQAPPQACANKAVTHPTQSVTIAAYEDRQIRFFDHNSAAVVHSMVAHLDSVTSLAVDTNGLYLLSGSHDCSVRLWNLDDRTCVQEITAHRKKFDEAINDVALHPTMSFLASAGADALAKVFV